MSTSRRVSSDQQAVLAYAGLSLAVLLPLLKSGYVLALDGVYTPKLRLPTEVTSGYPFRAVLHFLNYLMPSQVIEKLILFSILMLSGVGMHRLIQTESQWPKYFAGIFYMINPFTYSRFMAGQYGVLLAYALLPFLLKALIEFFRKADWRSGAWVAGLSFLISIFSLHAIGFVVLLTLAIGSLQVYRHRHQSRYLKNVARRGLVLVVALLIASSYWLVPLIRGTSNTAHTLDQIDPKQAVAFETVGDQHLGLPLNVLGLYGFWGDREGMYKLPKDVIPFWPVLLAVILALGIAGIRAQAKRDRALTVSLVAVLLIAWVLAMGTAYPPLAGLSHWLAGHVPFYKGYREPGKFIALIALVEVYFAAYGVQALIGWLKSRRPFKPLRDFVPVLLAVPILYTPTMLWGFSGQLHPVQYPADWQTTNAYLDRDHGNFQVLFLPWHQYMRFGFADRVIVNPAKPYFDRPVIQGDNAELGLIKSSPTNQTSQFIEREILPASCGCADVGQRLATVGVKYVVLAKEADWQNYGYLDQQADLTVVSDSRTLKVYRNQTFREGK